MLYSPFSLKKIPTLITEWGNISLSYTADMIATISSGSGKRGSVSPE